MAIGAVLIITFTVSGGLKGTAYANIIHCSVVIFGLMLVGLIVMDDIGGWGSIIERASEQLAASEVNESAWWSFTGIGIATSSQCLSQRLFILQRHSSMQIMLARPERRASNRGSSSQVCLLLYASCWVSRDFTMSEYGPESGLTSYLTSRNWQ